MSKAVLISINPKWCAMIASGEKTVEIRKNRPQIKPPFKCYIYCTKGAPFLNRHNGKLYIEQNDKLGGRGFGLYERLNGKVIGDFVCDRLLTLPYGQSYDEENVCIGIYTGARMKAKELYDYAKGKTVYGWHISDLKIYDTPKELGEFYHWIVDSFNRVWPAPVTRPPQSWMYIDD